MTPGPRAVSRGLFKKKFGRCDSIEIGFVNGNQEGTGAVENQLRKMIPSGYLT